ncbi:DUF4350 domain-containing protein [Candidatus Poribacteria bacterium]|nr:DUF4350 domain-containing protein [Candidatus Poribacteria bacterium]
MKANTKSTRWNFVFLVALITVFFFGLVRLFMLRYEIGDVYPMYSSYRSDPLGSRALYGATESIGKISVRRNLRPLSLLGGGRGQTLVIFAANLSEDPKDTILAIEKFVADGGRLVITFFPFRDEPAYRFIPKEEEETKEKKGKEGDSANGKERKGEEEDGKGDDESDEPCRRMMVSIEKRWSFSFSFWPLPESKSGDYAPAFAMRDAARGELPSSLSWHTALFFDKLDSAWQTLYSRDGRAVIIERPWGRGTMALCSDSYFISNEAMRKERRPALLAWLIGSSTTVVFDETHFGIAEQPGIMTLVRKYRLHGLLAGLAVLVALFVWKNAFSLVPGRAAGEGEDANSARGKDAAAGLVNLLRRSIPTRRILSVCLEEWQRSFAYDPKSKGKQGAQIQAVIDRENALPPMQRDSVRAYKDICAILAERDWKRGQ